MKLYSFLLFLFLFQINSLNAQEVRIQVLDAANKQPIQYASVIFGENRGTVTNEEGYFSFRKEEEKSDRIKISSMGYELLELNSEDLLKPTVFLIPATIELTEVFLSNKNLSAKEIIKQVKAGINSNYDFGLSQKRVFLRESNTSYIRRFDLKVDESTIPGIDQKLMNDITSQIPKVSDSYKEVLADLYGNYDNQKLKVIKAANLSNPKSTESLTELTDQLEQLFKQNLKKNSYLKIRSGIIGFKMDAKELEEELAESEAEKKEKTPEEKAKKHENSQKNLANSSKIKVTNLLKGMFWKEDITFNLFEKSNRYEFKKEGFANIDKETVYVISFKPKRGADFKGKIYVNTLDYGVHRIDFDNVKPLKRFRLFGISTADDVYRGKMIFLKNANGKYEPSYLEKETGETVGIDRPLTIIEKNKTVKGRRKQNELDLDIKIKVSQLDKLQLVFYENSRLSQADFDAVEKSGDFEYKTFKAYNPDFWNGYNIMEPNEAIKKFTAPADK